jgi:hypothetical protein
MALEGRLIWTASDLTVAAECKYALLRTVDYPRSRARFLQEHQSTGSVLGGTAWTFSHPDLLAAGPLDLMVVDEAGQFSLAATMAASIAARRL